MFLFIAANSRAARISITALQGLHVANVVY